MKIISGGQTGADLGALNAAKAKNIRTGGYIPKGFLTEDGPMPMLKDFDLIEMNTTSYPPRTRMNVKESDMTIIFKIVESKGCALTERICKELEKPYLIISTPNHEAALKDIAFFIISNRVSAESEVTINVAGNRETKCPGIQKFVCHVMTRVFEILL